MSNKATYIIIKKIKYFGRHSNYIALQAANLIYTRYHYAYGLGFMIMPCIKGDYITLFLAMLPMKAITCNTY